MKTAVRAESFNYLPTFIIICLLQRCLQTIVRLVSLSVLHFNIFSNICDCLLYESCYTWFTSYCHQNVVTWHQRCQIYCCMHLIHQSHARRTWHWQQWLLWFNVNLWLFVAGELLYLIHKLLPPECCNMTPALPNLLSYASDPSVPSTQNLALAAVAALARLHTMLKRRPAPASLFLDRTLQAGGWSHTSKRSKLFMVHVFTNKAYNILDLWRKLGEIFHC